MFTIINSRKFWIKHQEPTTTITYIEEYSESSSEYVLYQDNGSVEEVFRLLEVFSELDFKVLRSMATSILRG